MKEGQSSRNLGPRDESSCSGVGAESSWEEWDELALGLPDDVWDAFDLDDALEEPEPEYGDFWRLYQRYWGSGSFSRTRGVQRLSGLLAWLASLLTLHVQCYP